MRQATRILSLLSLSFALVLPACAQELDISTLTPVECEAVSEELEAFLVQKHQRYCVCKPVPNASAIGTAAASLLRD